MCALLLPDVASSLDADRLVVLDEIGPVDAGVHGRGSRQLAWSNGLGWVGYREVEQVETSHVIQSIRTVHFEK